MSNPRPQKWDWSSHLPRMIALYDLQMSIPDIYKAIQCDGFEPCQRSVYAKFKSLGYPTDPVGRSKLLDARRPPSCPPPSTESTTTVPSSSTSCVQSPTFFTSDYAESTLCALPEDHMLADPADFWNNEASFDDPVLPRDFSYSDLNGDAQLNNLGQNHREHHRVTSDPSSSMSMQSAQPGPSSEVPSSSVWSPCSDGTSSQHFSTIASNLDPAYDFETSEMEINGADYFGIDMGSNQHQVALPGTAHDLVNPSGADANWGMGMDGLGYNLYHSNASVMDLDSDSAFQADFTQPLPRRSGSIDLKTPFQNFINTSNSAGTRNKIRSLFRTKSGSSTKSSKKYATSQYTSGTQDSGYASGFASCLTLEDIRQINSQSLREFNELYRVACHNLHEPQAKAQCKDIATCAYCKYSSIHNLGWSARYLKLEVFLSELRLEGVYDFGALDAAGNTALHYAAAGGASFRHLKALIDVGVDPYVANTAGELFIYCLRPIQPFTLEPNSDCLSSDDLISLLGLLKPERVYDWRDNDGQTILHALMSKISELDLRSKIIEIFKNAGYPPTVRDRFGKVAEKVTPLTYDCHGQVIDVSSAKSIEVTIENPDDGHEGMTWQDVMINERRQQQVKQIKAQDIVQKARHSPTYQDPSTDDNVLHALSRLKSSNDTLLNLEHFSTKDARSKSHNREGHNILLNLDHFVARGADLNLHNRDGDPPLKSFICERPPLGDAETGATMSKYLDAILWIDRKARIRSQVNVNMRDREGATALHCAAARGRPDSVRSLLEAGANANARSDDGTSVLQATCNALDKPIKDGDVIQVHLLKEVIAHLEHAGAVLEPKSIQERGVVGTGGVGGGAAGR